MTAISRPVNQSGMSSAPVSAVGVSLAMAAAGVGVGWSSAKISGWATTGNSGCDSLAEVGKPRSVDQSGISFAPVFAARVSVVMAAVGAGVG